MKLFDAHNHLQDDRFRGKQTTLIENCARKNIVGMVVNGSSEQDWQAVHQLALNKSGIIPAFGYHPWYVHEASAQWKERLIEYLTIPGATVGEIGIDRWKPGLDFNLQRDFFTDQLLLAHERNLPASIHCLKAWGPLIEILIQTPLPARGFLVHSYSGPVELIKPLVKLGAYFSCAGNYLAPQKSHKLEVFSQVPLDRLLVESDAPDQNLPDELDQFRLFDQQSGKRINHPGNLEQVYHSLARQRQIALEDFAAQIEENFARLFSTSP